MAERGKGKSDSRDRRIEERRRRILDVAREYSESEGWAAVTTRRLADAIGYTQPVLYGHFPGGKSEIMRTVALEGFEELARMCRASAGGAGGRPVLQAVSTAYLDFAERNPALYEAMFRLPIDAHFAADDSEVELQAGFSALADAIGDGGDGTATEVLWGALHGLADLARSGRVRPEQRERRITEIATRFGEGDGRGRG
ncbi:TetR/AcrR family transcriptional regulator [Tsukamurella sp. 8F]|uniref:TetR/AcrR family transcriptional regulator n=1 Tax=unclassified Tsukamurella TaxID=2633480 RepID=UPI0023B9335D|nr:MULTISPECIES: TetR/AcrR family transcriptional regulator [unclassified Tsukamurella]MDF0530385.1 TetR/AcrR family transcriptional regulator [Tsukamurella sp. 8J]MDF0587682.1 TetR/AcrR family transcriptional regulator [Tsukamurella sp. 8F]